MKKIYAFFIFALLWCNISLADKKIGQGELQLNDQMVDFFMEYLKTPAGQSPLVFFVAVDDNGEWYATYWYCPEGNCAPSGMKSLQNKCNITAKRKYNLVDKCFIFAKKNYIVWENGINPAHYKKSSFKRKWDRNEVINKLTDLGFYGGTKTKEPKKVENKKEVKKTAKKYELKGERSIALSWEGYEDLIAGSVKFDETNYRGTLELPLPNNDGSCDGTYSLQQGGKGTWQIACTNDMGAAGTLKWIKGGGVTGIGRDHNDKKVKFTVSKAS